MNGFETRHEDAVEIFVSRACLGRCWFLWKDEERLAIIKQCIGSRTIHEVGGRALESGGILMKKKEGGAKIDDEDDGDDAKDLFVGLVPIED